MSDKQGKANAATEMYDDLRWLPPVQSKDLLPTDSADVRPGHVCFVIGEGAIFEWREDGQWHNQADK